MTYHTQRFNNNIFNKNEIKKNKINNNKLRVGANREIYLAILAKSSMLIAGLVIFLGKSSFAIADSPVATLAQIIPDTTLGNENSVIIRNVNINGTNADQINGGAIRDSNLFHSFREFNVGDGQRVYFANPSGINNILSRVTGNNPSNILGTLGVNGNANLFLINPNGIIFGKNASLDVGKSFYVTTANSIKFGELGEFNASNPQSPSPLLTIHPSAFFFNGGTNPGNIINQSRATQTVQGTPTDGLQVPNGQTLLLLGGNVTVDDGRLIARGGRVEIGAIAGTGSVGLNADDSLSFPDAVRRGDVVFNNKGSANRSGIDVRFGNGGDIGITAGNISLSGGSVLISGIRQGLGTVNSQAGDIIITAESVALSNSTIFNIVGFNAIGNGGDITIQAGSFSLTDGAELVANTNAQGDVGNITVQVRDRVAFDGMDSEGFASGIFNVVREGATGNAGDIKLTAGSFSLTNGARLQTNTRGKGNAGNVIIEVRDRIYFDAVDISSTNNFTGIFTTVGTDGEGRGGDIYLQAGSLDVRNGAQLTANTFEKGDAGNIKIEVRHRVSFDGVSIIGRSAASSSVGEFKEGKVIPAIGQGGNIDIIAKSLSVTNGAGIGSSVVSGSPGDAGNVNIITNDTVIIQNGGRITVANEGSGKGGNIDIQANSLNLDDQSAISAETATNTGGNISFKLQDLLLLRRNSQISATGGTAQAGGDGGNITINIPDGFIVAFPQENSDITANAFQGSGGKVNINATGVFGIKPLSRSQLEQLLQTSDPTKLSPSQLQTSDITAISQTNASLNGDVNLNILDSDPSQGLQELPTDIVDVSGLINQNLCAVSQGSEFIVTGRGGLPASPYEVFSADTGWEDWWIAPSPKPSTRQSTVINNQPNGKITNGNTPHNSTSKVASEARNIIEAQGWIKDASGKVFLIANPVKATPKGTWLHPQDCQLILNLGF